MIAEVEKMTQNPNRGQLLAQLRYISNETNDVKSVQRKVTVLEPEQDYANKFSSVSRQRWSRTIKRMSRNCQG